MIALKEINKNNKHWVNRIKANAEQRCLLHYNAYWYGQSLIVDDIDCFLIENDGEVVGFVAFGQYYLDEYLQELENKVAEIIHLVIDEKFQKKGIGKVASTLIIKRLKNENYSKVVVAVSDENIGSQLFWPKLNFVKTDSKNYDGDDVLEYILIN